MPALRTRQAFRGYITVADKCESCGLDFAGGDTGDGPAAFMVLIIRAFAVPAGALGGVPFRAALLAASGALPPVVLGATLLLLQPLKGVMVALQLHRQRPAATIADRSRTRMDPKMDCRCGR